MQFIIRIFYIFLKIKQQVVKKMKKKVVTISFENDIFLILQEENKIHLYKWLIIRRLRPLWSLFITRITWM